MLIDTHCHIHSTDYQLDADEVIERAVKRGVTKMLCVGTDEKDSKLAVEFVNGRKNCWASIGLHPHDAKLGQEAFDALKTLVDKSKVVAVGECGLDYYYSHSPKSDQIKALRWQIELALEHDLPIVFHVRDAFDDFWQVFDSYENIRGVVHSFSAGQKELERVLSRRLLVGLNGIMTFTRDKRQLAAARAVPLKSLVLETDSPFLTPVPKRGTVNEPAHVRLVLQFLAELRGESTKELTDQTSQNAGQLFGI